MRFTRSLEVGNLLLDVPTYCTEFTEIRERAVAVQSCKRIARTGDGIDTENHTMTRRITFWTDEESISYRSLQEDLMERKQR